MAEDVQQFRIGPATIDQAAGALALSLGALGSLLLVIWQSKCHLRCRLGLSDSCYIFDCTRAPPPEDPEKSDTEPVAPLTTKPGLTTNQMATQPHSEWTMLLRKFSVLSMPRYQGLPQHDGAPSRVMWVKPASIAGTRGDAG